MPTTDFHYQKSHMNIFTNTFILELQQLFRKLNGLLNFNKIY